MEKLNQYSRRNNVILDGVPEKAGEKPLDTIRKIASEHLTPLTAEIFGLARKPKLNRVETRDCAVFVQLKDERRLKITSKAQITEILNREAIPFSL